MKVQRVRIAALCRDELRNYGHPGKPRLLRVATSQSETSVWTTRPNRPSVELTARLLFDKRVTVFKPLVVL
jgi:hypothetical protein